MAVGGVRLSTSRATPAHCMTTQPGMPANEYAVSYSVFDRLASPAGSR